MSPIYATPEYGVQEELSVHQHRPEDVKSSFLHFGVLTHVCVFVCMCWYVCVCVCGNLILAYPFNFFVFLEPEILSPYSQSHHIGPCIILNATFKILSCNFHLSVVLPWISTSHKPCHAKNVPWSVGPLYLCSFSLLCPALQFKYFSQRPLLSSTLTAVR